jgi:hypothetical protein
VADAGERKLTGTFHILIIEEFTFVWFQEWQPRSKGMCWFGTVPRADKHLGIGSEKGVQPNRYSRTSRDFIQRLLLLQKVLLNGSIFWVPSTALQ